MASWKAKKILFLVFVAVASATITSFILFASSNGWWRRATAPSVPLLEQRTSGDNLIIASGSIRLRLPQRDASTATPPGFKGPTGAPHIKGPTSPPPDY